MPAQAGTIERLLLAVGRALAPLEEALAPANALTLFAELGRALPPGVAAHPAFGDALNAASSAAGSLPGAVTGLADAITADNPGQITARGIELGARIASLVDALDDVSDRFTAAATAAGVPAADAAAFAAELGTRIAEHMLVRALEDLQPDLARILPWTGLIDRIPHEGAGPERPPFIERRLRLDRLGRLLSDPAGLAQELTGWGVPGGGAVLLTRLDRLLRQEGLVTTLTPPPPAPPTSLTVFAFTLTPGPAGGVTLEVGFPAPGIDLSLSVSDAWTLRFRLTAALGTGLRIVLTPPGSLAFQPPSGTLSGEAQFEALGERSEADPFILIGQTGGSRLQVRRARLALGVRFSSTAAEPTVEAEVGGGKVVIDLSSGDGFIAAVAGGGRMEANLDLLARWSPSTGMRLEGSGAIELAIPTHISLGPVEITTIYLIVGLGPGGSLPAEVSVAFTAALGPLKAAVDRIGVRATTTFPPGGGNLGPADLAFAFKPPNGVGLSIDAGVVKGGGYLFIDAERGEYAGALELVFSGFLTLTAIGLITTRMPDGSSGFSLLVIITAEFGTGIQLGFGFTLLGVGGLLGLNRTMRLEALAEGVRTGGLNGILFPTDVVANAPRIISDLRSYFPPQEGKFLIGPMAKLGWGTPTLVSLSLGIIIEIPGNIAIVGVLKLALPDPDAALIVLQVSFIGAIEFDKKRIWFFASLFESRVLFLTIEGEMGLLVAFGDDANFVVSVGGFHPRFTPPPLPFPSPRRVAVNILNTDVARIRVEGYFAVTSNSVQFGARAEMFFGFDALNVSGHIAFDALFQFSPFFFIIEISASFGVKVFGAGLFSISARFSLEGPARWRARGTGSISILFFEISVDFDVSWGEARDTTLPPIQVMPLLRAELEKAQNWRAELPSSTGLRVTLRQLPAEEAALVLHPVGVLRVTQRALPLELTLDKVGNQKPSDVKRLTLSVAPGGLAKRADVMEQFAPAQFQKLSDGDKLSRPAYGPERGGLDLSSAGAQLASSRAVRRTVRYEMVTVDTGWRRHVRFFGLLVGGLFQFLLKGGSVGRSELSKQQKDLLQPFAEKVAVRSEGYTVAFQADNRAFSPASASFASEAGAREFLRAQTALDPNLADTLHVIPEFERAA